MHSFQAGGITSFPSDTGGFPFGNIPPHAFIPTVSTDGIQARSLGNATGDHTSKRARLAYARPPPIAPSGRTKRTEGGAKQEFWVPCKMTRPCLYKKGGINTNMKKVTQFHALPVRVELHKDTPWGGVYNGDNFLPGSAQLHIAEQCSLIDPKNSAWATVPGCFLSKSSYAQLVGTGPKFMGGASIKPLYYPPHAKWSDIHRKPMVYIPNPIVQMTAQQLEMYQQLAVAHEEPVGMDAIDDGEGDEAVEESESTNSINDNVEKNYFSNDVVRLSNDSNDTHDSAQFDNNASTTLSNECCTGTH